METTPTRKKGMLAYNVNPFWEPTEVKVGSSFVRVAGGTHVGDEGDSVKHSGIHIVKHVDKDEFVKLYTKNIKAIFDLKPTTQKVLQYLMKELQKTPNADAIYLAWLGANHYFSEVDIKVSRASFHRAMNELLNKKFIAESTMPNMYWFNPHLFFNGDRMSFIKEYKIKKKEGDSHLQKDAFNDK
jgi:hypothetical protein